MLASHGARISTRNASNFIPHTSASAAGKSRAIHIPSFVRVRSPIPQAGRAQKLFTQSHNLLSQFFNLLTAPGIRVPTGSPVVRSLHTTARSHTTIQQGFSFPVRTALSRPLNSHILPRAPALPRTVAQVGFGTARNFSSGRPIFQNLVENVPVVGRAFYEADWELKVHQEQDIMRMRSKSKSLKKVHRKEMLKPTQQNVMLKENQAPSQPQNISVEEDLDHFFIIPTTPDVTTCLLIPLAPTPTARTPLSPFPNTDPTLLPLHDLATMHNAHGTHSLRVSSLFSRLDVANVWERGVRCSAFSHGGDHDGVCTMLKVEFVGWTKAEVRSVLGESGTGWCVLEEINTACAQQQEFSDDDDDTLSDLLSDTSSMSSDIFGNSHREGSMGLSNVDADSSQSFILPTLDFSSSFTASSIPVPSQPRNISDLHSFSFNSNFDPWSKTEASSDSGESDIIGWVDPSSMNGWFGFSSQFSDRARTDLLQGRPREFMF
ncbi:hypothetical protein BDZ94DRAFT_1251490 [Collybia nuda]|uniref:Uncharacterized protein n=1 Tax=Collybia nuda TaxID=64659 RepID=A0A9P5YCN4_9AGAR|nr:hypothetical protein BDZ94DRAFT_1251490 [Collybia nuda]